MREADGRLKGLVTPLSHLFSDPSDGARIATASDGLEARDTSPGWAPSAVVAIHSEVSLVHRWEDATRTHLLALGAQWPNAVVLSLHAATCGREENMMDGRFVLSGDGMDAAEMLENAEANVLWLKESLGHLGLAVENNNHLGTPAYDPVTDPVFLTELVQCLEMGLVLDIAHALISADYRGVPPSDYLSALPLERVIQVHIACPDLRGVGQRSYDAHHLPTEREWGLLETVVRTAGPTAVTLEFYGTAEELLAGLGLARERIRGTGPDLWNTFG